MKMNMFKQNTVIALIGMILLGACVKEYDNPPIDTIPTGSLTDIAELRQLYADSGSVRFTTDISFYATVTADEVSGNLYKNIYIQDGTGALNLALTNSGGIYQGDQIRVNLNGLTLREDNDFLILDSVDVDLNVVKQKTKVEVEPLEIELSELHDSLQGYLVKISNVQFNYKEFGKTYADVEGKSTVNLMLEDCDGLQVIVRNSGYANFAGLDVPFGQGDITVVIGQYRNDMQLYIRDIDEVNLEGDRCPGTNVQLFKGFDDESVTSGGWVNIAASGNVIWGIYSGSNPAASCSNYDPVSGSKSSCESWLISPAVNMNGMTNPKLNFRNVYRYPGPQLKAYITTNYTGDVASTTWIDISSSVLWDTDNSTFGSWTDSGDIDLSAYINEDKFRVAFKYTGTSSAGSTWELDEILIAE